MANMISINELEFVISTYDYRKICKEEFELLKEVDITYDSAYGAFIVIRFDNAEDKTIFMLRYF